MRFEFIHHVLQAIMLPENEQKSICLLLGICLILFAGCSTMIPARLYKGCHSIIPIPQHIFMGDELFFLNAESGIRVSGTAENVGHFLSKTLQTSTGFPFPVVTDRENNQDINLLLDPGLTSIDDEGYTLDINQDGIRIIAVQPAGLFYGCQTLLQLLPQEIFSSHAVTKEEWEIPFVTIQDSPRFTLSGEMLYVSRHFFGVRDVKRFIDLMAMHKLNRFHIHLSDDQGWRIRINSWPNLALHGGSGQVGKGPGGYYTQEEFSDIVRYAHDRFIMVIPEIDMPGHTNAALSSYAELNSDGKAPELYRGTRVGFSCLDIHSEVVYQWINDVISELAALTPGPYIHIGGDEVKEASDEDYIYFINRVQDIVQSAGKQMIGWDEIGKANLYPSTIIQYWNNIAHAKKAAANGNKLIFSQASKLYLDMMYDESTPLGQNWAGAINVKDAYTWGPEIPELPEDHILGIEAPLWTETVVTREDIEYLTFPRLAGYAERAWSPEEKIDWNDYKERLAQHGSRLNELGVHYYKSPLITW